MRIQGVKAAEFEEFYAARRDPCLRAVFAAVGDRDLAEEAVAEAFARAWAAWPQLRRHPAPSAWIVRTALNARVSWWRRRRREVALEVDSAGPASAEPDGDLGLDPALLVALRRLPQRQREVLAMRVLLDLDSRSTAKALGIAEGTVTAHLARATATLRSQLATNDHQEVLR